MDSPAGRSFRIRKNVITMLIDRGYRDAQQYQMSFRDFVDAFGQVPVREQMTMIVKKPSGESVLVVFPLEAKVGVNPIKEYYTRMDQEKIYHAIVIVIETFTPFALKYIKQIPSPFFFEEFKEEELLFNITEHEMVPPHDVMSEEEKQAVLKFFKADEHQMPRISLADPVAKYLGLKRGTMVRITRPSETAGMVTVYRIAS